jgi:hypothetical protein
MMNARMSVLTIVTLIVVATTAADAADGPFRRALRLPPIDAPRVYDDPTGHYRHYRYDPPWEQPDLYPKWYGGFHSRALTTLGYPHGDIGLRGLPW